MLTECDLRFAAAAALCFVQGWRINEALGLAWEDLDLGSGSVLVRRGSTYADGIGMTLGPTKTRGAMGTQFLGRTAVALLEARREMRLEDEENLPERWPTVEYDGQQLDLVFTTAHGTPTLRQHVDRAIRRAAERAGIDSVGLGTHAGRRSVVTNLFASGTVDLEDVARFVGHNDVATTRGYVQHEGDRPRQVCERALELLDPPSSASGRSSSTPRTLARTTQSRRPRPSPPAKPSTLESVVQNDIREATASVHAVISPTQSARNTIVIGIPRIASCNQPSDDNAAITPDTTIAPTATANATQRITPPIY